GQVAHPAQESCSTGTGGRQRVLARDAEERRSRLDRIRWIRSKEMADLIKRLRACADSDMVPMEKVMHLLTEAAEALEDARLGLRYVVRVWVLSDEIVWSEEKIDEVVEDIIADAKKEKGK